MHGTAELELKAPANPSAGAKTLGERQIYIFTGCVWTPASLGDVSYATEHSLSRHRVDGGLAHVQSRLTADVAAKAPHTGMTHNGPRSHKSRIKFAGRVGGGAPRERHDVTASFRTTAAP